MIKAKQATKHQELITSIESEALLLVRGVIAVLDSWTLIHKRGMEGGGRGCRQFSGKTLKKQTLSQLPQAVESSSELRRGEPQVRSAEN